jgi:hypothetical protein
MILVLNRHMNVADDSSDLAWSLKVEAENRPAVDTI